ncbi:hypothetical protein QQ045_033424 [Rhodiola kirilowii]
MAGSTVGGLISLRFEAVGRLLLFSGSPWWWLTAKASSAGGEKDNLCLYGFPDETWSVSVPVQDIPPEIPEPMLDIRSLRYGMPTNQWLRYVAVRCDSWLHYVAFHTATRHGLGKSDWTRLFSMINDLRSMYDTLLQSFVKQIKDKSSSSDYGSDTSESLSGSETGSESYMLAKLSKLAEVEKVSEDEWANDDTICGICKKNHSEDQFWICCQMCEKWLHGMCVKITKAEFTEIKEYKCPSCCKKP